MKYVVDTVAIIKYLEGTLPHRSRDIFRNAIKGKYKLIMPGIVIGEFIYAHAKGGLESTFPDVTAEHLIISILNNECFEVTEMTVTDWLTLSSIPIPELHDRMICAIAISAKVDGIITSDETITKAGIVNTIWK